VLDAANGVASRTVRAEALIRTDVLIEEYVLGCR
jgi:hypothetical protein